MVVHVSVVVFSTSIVAEPKVAVVEGSWSTTGSDKQMPTTTERVAHRATINDSAVAQVMVAASNISTRSEGVVSSRTEITPSSNLLSLISSM
jgi:hypothetical protein